MRQTAQKIHEKCILLQLEEFSMVGQYPNLLAPQSIPQLERVVEEMHIGPLDKSSIVI